MHKLTAGDGYAYLTRHVAAGDAGLEPGRSLAGYYEQTGNPAGRWYGDGLTGLGDAARRLHPGDVVTEQAMTAVFRDGLDPLTEDALGRAYSRFDDGKRHAVVGYDLTFTAPKSASVLWALADDATRAIVYDAHRAALASSLEFLEQRAIRTRTGEGGRYQVRTRGMVAAAFDHWDTRAGDPNLHTHVVIANKVQGPDGVWRSVDGKTVHAATVTISELYDTLLADELARRLPVAWSRRDRGPRRNPAFELEGIPDDVLAHFSARSEQIHCAEQDWAAQFLATHGHEPSRVEITKARQFLTRTTRPPKTVRPLADLLAEWANRARALTGMEPRDLAARALRSDYGRALHAHDVGPEVKAAIVAQMLADVSTKRSVWNTWNLAAEALRVSKPLRMASPAQRRTLLNSLTVQAADVCVHLDDTRDPTTRRVGENLYTSVELLAAEKVLLDASEAVTAVVGDQRHRPVLMTRLASHLDGLAPDQAAAARAVVASGHTVDALVGPAGSGKTTTLGALTAFWRGNVGPFVALAPSATAAHTLSRALGVDCETTAKWLYETSGDGARRRAQRVTELQQVVTGGDYATASAARQAQWDLVVEQRRWALAPRQLVIVDEASLAHTRALADLTLQAQAAGAKVLLVGDHLQRGSVDAGGAFAMLARRGPTAELTSLWRFANPWEARASLELRHGRPSALDAYAAHGAFTAGPQDDMLEGAFAAVADARGRGRTAVLQAADNRTVRELNTRAHANGVLTGTVSRDGVVLHDGLTAGVGDRIVTRHNNRRLVTESGFVRNGDLWDVTAIHPDGSLRVRPADASTTATVRLPAAYVAEHVELGYATSTARSQGMTVDETHTIAVPGMAREDLYVAMSRGRHHNHTYVVLDQPDPDCLPGHGAPATAREVLDQILATTHTERSATETWETFHPGTPLDADALEAFMYRPSPRPSVPPSAPGPRTAPSHDRDAIEI
ncbi:conjugal transfer protein [Actinotalea ferrariae CF5-4]|uniref:Conjugal transfer protein n=1 Tax=Actinotalea ferrariae CF5-4 TaxID=948458 RepID=A0A021W1R8_9CELL|nr:MobF family relaxase [Actinotalea ferrariae]EYR65282.1 conjugal transfer protein [Actinotalea ferrariae CF5-4]